MSLESKTEEEMKQVMAALKRAAPKDLPTKPRSHPNNLDLCFYVNLTKDSDYQHVQVTATSSSRSYRHISYDAVTVEVMGLRTRHTRRTKRFPITREGKLNEGKIWGAVREYLEMLRRQNEHEAEGKKKAETRERLALSILDEAGLLDQDVRPAHGLTIIESNTGEISISPLSGGNSPEHPRASIYPYDDDPRVRLKLQGYFSKARAQEILARMTDDVQITLAIEMTLPASDAPALVKEVFRGTTG